jgi:hypothetical protein
VYCCGQAMIMEDAENQVGKVLCQNLRGKGSDCNT